ncbi:hypothetical protein, partial [Pedobacter rhizosphaerae]
FQVKYSFVHEDIEGIFTVVGKAALGGPEERVTHFSLSSEFAEDSRHYGSMEAKAKVDDDLASAQSYLNDHIKEDSN